MHMEVRIDFTKSAQENASEYFEKSKRARRKAAGALEAVERLQKILEMEKKEASEVEKPRLKAIYRQEWYEKFNWFNASNGMLSIGGSDAQQNELINSKYFGYGDLFFHADIYGGSLVVLKDGTKADKNAREEAAQFAACYSRAWGQRLSAIDVYAMKREQVTKSKEKGSLATGSFLLKGEREWYKGMELELSAFVTEYNESAGGGEEPSEKRAYKRLNIVPSLTRKRLGVKGYVSIKIGSSKKSDAAKYIAKALGYDDVDYVMRHLPAGLFSANSVSG